MTVAEIFALDLPITSDRQLNQAWLDIGAEKLRIRQALFNKSDRMQNQHFKSIQPELVRLNRRLIEIWDEIFARQLRPNFLRKGEPFIWEKAANPLRWEGLPCVTDSDIR